LLEQLVASPLSSTTLQQVVNKPLTTCHQRWEQVVGTHPVDKLLERHCYKSAAGLLQLVRFYVRCCIPSVVVLRVSVTVPENEATRSISQS
jgi:hypothetical protein